MLGTLATLVTYRNQPKSTFVMKHPVKTVKLMKMRHDVRDTFTPQRIAAGLGVAALAIPLGIWIGRQLNQG